MESLFKDNNGKLVSFSYVDNDWYDNMNYDLAQNDVGMYVDGDYYTSGGHDKLVSDIKKFVKPAIRIELANDLAKYWHDDHYMTKFEKVVDYIPAKDIETADDYIDSVNSSTELNELINSLIKHVNHFKARHFNPFYHEIFVWIFNTNNFDWKTFAKNEKLTNDITPLPEIDSFLEDVALGTIFQVKRENKKPIYITGSYIDDNFDADYNKMLKEKFNALPLK